MFNLSINAHSYDNTTNKVISGIKINNECIHRLCKTTSYFKSTGPATTHKASASGDYVLFSDEGVFLCNQYALPRCFSSSRTYDNVSYARLTPIQNTIVQCIELKGNRCGPGQRRLNI